MPNGTANVAFGIEGGNQMMDSDRTVFGQLMDWINRFFEDDCAPLSSAPFSTLPPPSRDREAHSPVRVQVSSMGATGATCRSCLSTGEIPTPLC